MTPLLDQTVHLPPHSYVTLPMHVIVGQLTTSVKPQHQLHSREFLTSNVGPDIGHDYVGSASPLSGSTDAFHESE
jgi:hypothetical protein